MNILILLFTVLGFNAFAAEVTTLSFNKNSANEMTLITTDETFSAAMEKHFMAKACKLRTGMSSIFSIKEIKFPTICQAEVIKFLLNNDFKPDPNFRVFTK